MYLGLTSEPLQRRLDRHAREDSWFQTIDLERVTVTLFADREAAQAELTRRFGLARQPYVNPNPLVSYVRPKGRPKGPGVLSRVRDSRDELREAERGMGFPAGTAVRAADGSIDWDWDRLKALGVV